MRLIVLLMAGLLAACAAPPKQPDLNFAPGTYRDFADYMMAIDPEIMKDAANRSATRDQAHCAAEKLGRYIHGPDYDLLSQAVSGRRAITPVERSRTQQQQDQFAVKVRQDPDSIRPIFAGLWIGCV